ncbi:MAG: hypothetical protein JSR46_06475, partial [Verrucomicrobia bacterium]|nr:hypothetical protein [Verrucomicrobiota bacterium]
SWQHDARFLSHNVVSLFDDNSDGSSTPEPPSHGLVLQLDLENMTASPLRTYYHDPNISVASQGNLQSLENGNTFIGWGQSPYYSEFRGMGNSEGNPSHNMLYDAQIPQDTYSYRAYRHCWVGKPHYPPSIAVRSHHCHTHVFASWNGSTEAKEWRVLAGRSPKKLKRIKCVPKTGFETIIETEAKGPYFRVEALNCEGKVIGKSKVVKY